jgi:hypothetical protein
MLNYLKKFAMEILPSVAATIIGAYIVNHYIAAKPGSQPPTAAAVSTAQPKADAKKAEAKADIKADAKADAKADTKVTGDVANLPEAGVKARGISEKALLERNAAAEKAVVEKPAEKAVVDKAAEKAADKPSETASIPAEPRRHTPASRDKTAVRVIPLTPSQPAAAPVAAAPASTPAAEAAVVPEERRDANDLARAAIERLRGNEGAPRSREARAPEAPRIEAPRIEASRIDAPRIPEVARVPDAPRIEPALRPLPPPVMVSTPSTTEPPANARVDDPQRPTPPAEIPAIRPPLDLRAEMTEPKREKDKTSVAEDMLSAAKSVFHSVLPK